MPEFFGQDTPVREEQFDEDQPVHIEPDGHVQVVVDPPVSHQPDERPKESPRRW
jgi:hypothetical protein